MVNSIDPIRILAVWRLTNLLVEEDGPGRVFRRLREASGITYDAGDEIISHSDWTPLHCFYCASIWVALVSHWIPDWLLRVLALSAAAVMLEVPESFLRSYQREKIE